MKIGKISETILKRSIIKNISYKRREVLQGAGVGNDYSALKLSSGILITVCDTIARPLEETPSYPVDRICNNILTSGGEAVAVMVQLTLPSQSEEVHVKQLMNQLGKVCKERRIQIMGGNTIVSEYVSEMIMSITGYGYVDEEKRWGAKNVKAGQEVVLCGPIARYETQKLAYRNKEQLLERFSPSFLDKMYAWENITDISQMIKVCRKAGVLAVHDLSESGIFGGLWELACSHNMGIEADISKILIKQETVEMGEFFGVNPYEMPSVGNVLAVTDEGSVLVQMLEQEGIRGAVIGRLIQGNDKYVICHEEKRFLTPPR